MAECYGGRAGRWRTGGALAGPSVPGASAPLAALALYLWHGAPGMPSAPYAERQAALARMESERGAAAAQEEALLARLREVLAQQDPRSERAREGYVMLGRAERSRGRLAEAAAAFTTALEARFDPDLAAQLAQVLLEADRGEEAARLLAGALAQAPQHVGLRFLSGLADARAGRNAEARAAWTALLADAPPDAPWRAMVERRMQDLP